MLELALIYDTHHGIMRYDLLQHRTVLCYYGKILEHQYVVLTIICLVAFLLTRVVVAPTPTNAMRCAAHLFARSHVPVVAHNETC